MEKQKFGEGVGRRVGTGKKCCKFKGKASETGSRRPHGRARHEMGEPGTGLGEDPPAGHGVEGKTSGTLTIRGRGAPADMETEWWTMERETRRVSSRGRPGRNLPGKVQSDEHRPFGNPCWPQQLPRPGPRGFRPSISRSHVVYVFSSRSCDRWAAGAACSTNGNRNCWRAVRESACLLTKVNRWFLHLPKTGCNFVLLINLFIYLFIYFWLHWVFVAAHGLFSSCGVWASHCGGFSCCGAWASVVVTHGLSSCRARASLLRGMWDLPGPGLEPVSPASAGRFSTTAPPWKPNKL